MVSHCRTSFTHATLYYSVNLVCDMFAKFSKVIIMESAKIDEFNAENIFEMIRGIKDPEYHKTLEDLEVVSLASVNVSNARYRTARVEFRPTIPHCSMAAIIGLAIIVKLKSSLPRACKIDVLIEAGTHESEADINKQLADKERVAAAMENPNLFALLTKLINFNPDDYSSEWPI